jgi:hypothetical protein
MKTVIGVKHEKKKKKKKKKKKTHLYSYSCFEIHCNKD